MPVEQVKRVVELKPTSCSACGVLLIGYFTGRMGMSQRDVEESMGAVFHTDVSLGSIPAHICSKIVRLDICPYL